MVSEALDSFGNVIHVHTTSLQSLQPLQSFIYPSSGRHSSSTTSSSAAAAAAAAAAYSNDGYPQQTYQRGEHHYENPSGGTSVGRIDPNLYSKIESIPSYKSNLHGGGHVYTMSPPPPSYDSSGHTATLYSATTSLGTTIAFNPSGSGEGNSGNNIQYRKYNFLSDHSLNFK